MLLRAKAFYMVNGAYNGEITASSPNVSWTKHKSMRAAWSAVKEELQWDYVQEDTVKGPCADAESENCEMES